MLFKLIHRLRERADRKTEAVTIVDSGHAEMLKELSAEAFWRNERLMYGTLLNLCMHDGVEQPERLSEARRKLSVLLALQRWEHPQATEEELHQYLIRRATSVISFWEDSSYMAGLPIMEKLLVEDVSNDRSEATFMQQLASMKRTHSLLYLLDALENRPEQVSDEKILVEWAGFRDSLRTCCKAAADALLAALCSICCHRPAMFEKLLPDALEPLMMLGIEDASAVIQWVGNFAERHDPYMGRPDAAAIQWLRTEFPASKDAIQTALNARLKEADGE